MMIDQLKSAPMAPSASAHAPAPAVARAVMVWGDDHESRRRWADALAAEGLTVRSGDVASATGANADAWVMHATLGLAPNLSLLRSLRTMAPSPPLLVALRGLRDLDQVLALEMGADDVVDASTSAPVVAARLRALWRRNAAAGSSEDAPELRFGGLRLSRHERQVWLAGRLVPLTEGEFAVLWLLASHAGSTLPRRDILRRVRGLDDHPMDRSIDSRVYRIRAKLGDSDRESPRIRTVRNLGYAFLPSGW
jgi:DNA-binding response OmpR family regulator